MIIIRTVTILMNGTETMKIFKIVHLKMEFQRLEPGLQTILYQKLNSSLIKLDKITDLNNKQKRYLQRN